MNGKRRIAQLAALTLALSLTMALAVGDPAVAKKKGNKVAFVSGTVGAVPQGPTTTNGFGFPTTNPVPFLGTATVGNKFKKKTVGRVDATISLSGVSKPGTTCGGVCDVVIRLTAPNGAQTALMSGGSGPFGITGNTVTNLTLTDQTPTRTCGSLTPAPPPPCADPDATLLAPYTGTAEPQGVMNVFNGSPVKGVWTLTAYDFCGAAACGDSGTSSITAWSLKITPATLPK